jgi:transcriptional regulator GlxA family with amidase domain
MATFAFRLSRCRGARSVSRRRAGPRYTVVMRIAILTFDGFNEIDSFVAMTMLNRVRRPGWSAEITAPTERVTSMNGVTVVRQQPLAFAREADVVIVGSGKKTREVVADAQVMAELSLDPSRQLVGSQCSGALVLAKLGLLDGVPACTDMITKPWVVEAGVDVVDRPFASRGNVATAGGCLSSYYLATWVLARTAGRDVAAEVLGYITPVGEQVAWAERAFAAIAEK